MINEFIFNDLIIVKSITNFDIKVDDFIHPSALYWLNPDDKALKVFLETSDMFIVERIVYCGSSNNSIFKRFYLKIYFQPLASDYNNVVSEEIYEEDAIKIDSIEYMQDLLFLINSESSGISKNALSSIKTLIEQKTLMDKKAIMRYFDIPMQLEQRSNQYYWYGIFKNERLTFRFYIGKENDMDVVEEN